MAWVKVLLAGDAAELASVAPTVIAASDTAAVGTGTTAARDDHRHGSPATWPPSSHALSEHTAATANLDLAEFEAVALALQNAATNPTTTKLGRICFNTADSHPYVNC